MKHFEDLWEEGEIVSSQAPFDQDVSVAEIKLNLDLLSKCDKTQYSAIFGKILLELCRLSYRLDVNTYIALQKSVLDAKVLVLEENS